MASSNGGRPVIELADVTKTHRGGELAVQALRGIGFSIHRGEYVAIMGPSGSGKTTLLGILGCLDRPTEGSYKLDGDEVTGLSETRRAHVRGDRIGFVFQAYNLLPRLTAIKNVELPLIYAGVAGRERHVKALKALAEVGLGERANHRPSQLSGGEQQRVAIARALVVEPSVVLLDEPTGNLDSKSAEEILAIIDGVHDSGATIVMVTHSNDVAARSSRIVRLADGLVVADEPIEPAMTLGAAS